MLSNREKTEVNRTSLIPISVFSKFFERSRLLKATCHAIKSVLRFKFSLIAEWHQFGPKAIAESHLVSLVSVYLNL